MAVPILLFQSIDAFLDQYVLRLLLISIAIVYLVMVKSSDRLHWRWSSMLAAVLVLLATAGLLVVSHTSNEVILVTAFIIELFILTFAGHELLKNAISPQLASMLAFILAFMLLFYDLTAIERALPFMAIMKVLVGIALFFLMVFFVRFLL